MRHTFAFAVTLLALAACSSDYELRFECAPNGGAGCPAAEECPTVPLASGGCDGVPGLFGHEPETTAVGRVLGCRVHLPYESPDYPGEAQVCDCDDSSGSPQWLCPI